MAARDDVGGGTGSARRRRERRFRSFLRHERMSIAMTLAEYTHQSAQRQKKASVTEFFAMSTENSVEAQLTEDGVFPSVFRVMPVSWLTLKFASRELVEQAAMLRLEDGSLTRRAFSVFFGRVTFVQIIFFT